MAGCYTSRGVFFDVDRALATVADILRAQNLPSSARLDLEDMVEDFRCETCYGVLATGHEGPGLCTCTDDDDDW